jgi:hypothetical protein
VNANALSQAFTERADKIASSIDRVSGWHIVKYINGGLITMGGPYSTPRTAMSVVSDVGRWVEMSPTEWRSEDGRTLVRA